ncbi:hypothetical protein EC840_104153 [Rahnella sp. JUb53]|uniref:hypothetical protein n=1 Tax=Rahnella sp. JUb53 TaxID=2485128 RepID=UPI0010460113|nr:hypothetical protein [Rahnella sp. JUb53]TCQ89247.1 hypothetical protein EC840_104153 [Rahnella sp. JUb53]
MDIQKLETFFEQAKSSRLKHSTGDRLIALEVMVCAIGASLEGNSREQFLNTMNTFSENWDPMKDTTIKAIADLNVLSSDFVTIFNQSANK